MLLRITQLEVHMTKTQLKTLATKIHGLAVKSASGKKPAQNKALEKIAALLDQAIEAEIKQAYAGIASQVRGLADRLEPTPVRRAVGRKKVTRRKPVVAKKKPERRRGRVKPTERVAEQTETTTL
jgi:predicted NBD/HSP70 family sugar kinase